MSRNRPVIFAIIVIVLSIAVAYSNSLDCAWQLDDEPNITLNKALHIEGFTYESLKKTLFASPDGLDKKMYRPVACFTFALNWYFSHENVHAYHLVNIIVHTSTAILLYFTILQLTSCPRMKERYAKSHYYVALLGALFWALNPIQTQSVTYIVQRMASLAALFYLLAMFFYLRGRLSINMRRRCFYFAGCIVSFLLGLGSKEIVITLPLALMLLEAIFLQNLDKPETRRNFLYGIMAIVLCVLLVGSFLFLEKNIFSFLAAYDNRYFSFSERVLSQPRIIVMYLSQLFYPIPSRLSIAHDVILSKSMLTPWSTLPAILLLSSLVAIAIVKMKEYPFLALGILFYFLNHLIESTVIALELVFEHRNYLPSLFLFVAVASLLKTGQDYFNERPLRKILHIFPVLLVLLMISGAYIRNFDWMTPETLWTDALKKAPKSGRAYFYLAKSYQESGRREKALDYYMKSYDLAYQSASPQFAKANSLNGAATIYLQSGNLETGLSLLDEVLSINPDHEASRKNRTIALLELGRFDEALHVADKLVNDFQSVSDYHYLRGVALLRLREISAASDSFTRAASLDTENVYPNIGLAVAAKESKQFELAKQYFSRADKVSGGSLNARLGLLELAILFDDQDGVESNMHILNDTYTFQQLDEIMAENARLKLLFSVFSNEIVTPYVKRAFGQKIDG